MDKSFLTQLKDVHLPKEPSLWPLAGGYYILLSLLLCVVFLLCLIGIKLKKKKELRRTLIDSLKEIEKKYAATNDTAYAQRAVNNLVKRVLLYHSYKKNRIFKINNEKQEFLKVFKKAKNNNDFFNMLTKDRYKKSPAIDGKKLLHLAREHFKKCLV